MRVIVYGREEKSALSLADAVRALVPAAEVETCASVCLCDAKLAGIGTEEVVAIALAADREELAGLFLFRERLMDIPLILVLPEDSEETVCLGHRLQPRFVGFSDSGFRDVAAVVARLLSRLKHRQTALHRLSGPHARA
jgi:hypothetical protein